MATTSTQLPARAGRYVRQPAGYRAFVPAPLPPDLPVRLDGELRVLLSRADRALGRLDGSVVTLPNPDLLVFMYVRKEAVLSSQIEGTQSSCRCWRRSAWRTRSSRPSTRSWTATAASVAS